MCPEQLESGFSGGPHQGERSKQISSLAAQPRMTMAPRRRSIAAKATPVAHATLAVMGEI
jgi:hypothetical protein